MSNFYPIYNRSSDSLNLQRLNSTLQNNQRKLHEIQQRISTQQNYLRPSEDPGSALRSIRYQASIEQNVQYRRNLDATKGYLDSTDAQIRATSNILTEIKGAVPGWVGTVPTASDRSAAISQLKGFRDQLVSIGNTKYNGRYLFSGSDPSKLPYTNDFGGVVYSGNDGELQSLSTRESLLQNNISAQRVFGGISSQVEGSATLQPALSSETRLRDLRSGAGVSSGAIEIFDGSNTSVIDLTNAETIGDVVRAIEANPPEGRQINVEIKADRLEIRAVDGGGEQLFIRESNGGSVAAELGLRDGLATFSEGRLAGQSLSPVLNLTSKIDQVVGSPAVAVLHSPGGQNDVIFTAKRNGEELNNVKVQYVDSTLLQAAPGLIQGSETVEYSNTARPATASLNFNGSANDLILTSSVAGADFNNVQINVVDAGAIGNNATVNYDQNAKVLTVGIDSSGSTTAQSVINALAAEGTFTAVGDSSLAGFNPAATISAANIGTTTGNTGNSGGDANTIYVEVNPTLTQAKHVVAALQKNADVVADFDVQIDSLDGAKPPYPGYVTIDPTSSSVSGGGTGLPLDRQNGFQITIGDKTTHVPLDGVSTVEDVLNRINAADPRLVAQINPERNGINVGINVSGVSFSVEEAGGLAATQLGIRSFSESTPLSSLNFGQGVEPQNGVDFTINRNDGSSIDIDVSSARTVGDVLKLINEHPSNLDPNTRVVARLAKTGNGIELVDDNPTGVAPLSVSKKFGSDAAVHLGLIPVGSTTGYPSDATAPTKAKLDVLYNNQTNVNRSFNIEALSPGTQFNDVDLEIVSGATGDTATATYDSVNRKIVVQVDPSNTRTTTLVDAVNTLGDFRATLVNGSGDTYNNGSGIVSELGILGRLSGGSSQPAAPAATASLRSTVPGSVNTSLRIEAQSGGTAFNDVEVIFQSGLGGDNANAVYNPGTKQLTVTLNPGGTTSNTILAAINAEGTFTATLDTSGDATNDGTGVFGQTGTIATTADGGPGVLKGRDVSLQENESIFNTIDRLIQALESGDNLRDSQLNRAAGLLEQDINRLNESISDVGSRGQINEFLIQQNEDQDIVLRANLSNEFDTDLVAAISELNAQQVAVEASMRVIGQTFQQTLLNYI